MRSQDGEEAPRERKELSDAPTHLRLILHTEHDMCNVYEEHEGPHKEHEVREEEHEEVEVNEAPDEVHEEEEGQERLLNFWRKG